MVDEKQFNKIDSNNLKALGIIKHVLFGLTNGGYNEFDVISTLEAVQDYLDDTNAIFNTCV